MRRYTTPEDTFVIHGVDLTGCDVVVSYRQLIGHSTNAHQLDIDDPEVSFDGTDTTLTVRLTQEQTGGFQAGQCMVQVNWIDPDGVREATEIATARVPDNLLRAVMTYGGQ